MSDPVKSPNADSPEGEPEQKNKMLIVQILSEMHNVFNKSEAASENNVVKSEVPPPPSPSGDDSSSVVFEAQPVQEDEEEEKPNEKQEEPIAGPDNVGAAGEPEPEESVSEGAPVELIQKEPEPVRVELQEERVEEDAVKDEEKDEDEERVESRELEPLPSLEVDQDSAEVQAATTVEPESQELASERLSPVEQERPAEELAKQTSSESDLQDVPEASTDNSSGQSPEKVDTLKRKNFGRPSRVESSPRIDLQGEPFEKRTRRSMRNSEKVDQDVAVKRSSRRMSKDYNRESVLQNAIARKEKSLNSFSEEKPRRSSRLNDDPKTLLPPQRSPKSKVLARGSLSTDEGPSNGDSTSSPLRGTKQAFDDQDDTASDVSSRSVKKLRGLEFNLRLSSKVSSKESLAMDEDSASSWQAQPAFDALNDKASPSRFVPDTDRSESGSSYKEGGFKKKSHLMRVAEGSEPPILKDDKDFPPPKAATGLLCECEIVTSMYPKDPSTQLCRALDVYENRLVKCSNEVDEIPLLRPCKTKPFQAVCLIHFERMIRHNVCPSCGAFCTQGIVNICENKHFFHKECEMKLDETVGCPHCGSESYSLYKIQLQNHRYPLFLPSTKPFHKLPVAKMSISRKNRKSVEMFPSVVSEVSEILPPNSLTLPNGKVITSEGIPLPEKDTLEHLLKTANSQEDMRYTYRSLYHAAKTGDAEKVLHMLGSGMSPNQASMNPLMGAAREGHLLVVHLLVQAGANLETLDKYQFTPLMLAAQNKHNLIVKYLVKAGADIGFKGADGMTALHIAAKEGNLEACHYILSQVNLPASLIDTVDDGKWTALVWAAENCHSKVVRYLLQKKADPQIRDGEMNIALHWSAFAGSMEITEDLLNYGCSINMSNTHGDTPLHIAARQGADNCVVLLLARGAQVEAMNKAGQLPRDCVINKDSYCYTAIDLNMTIKKSIASTHFYPRILYNDVSGGREENPIQCVNAIDEELMPTDYTYVTENCVTSNVTVDRRISSLVCCKCEDNCNGSGCMCTKISRGSWFDNAGKLIPEFSFEDPPMLFECNPACGCNVLTCKNRVVQKGLKSRLQLCKTKDKSWGVITLKEIPKGTYVCEYIGEIISDLEADTRKDDSYLFDLDNAESETYCLDARRYGNICRFINHSCRPNLSPVKVYFQHQDLHFPRIAMFASRDIAPNEELGFDYGEKFWIIKCKSFTCHCGEPTCRYSESTIQQTLEKYQQKLRELDEMSDSAIH